MHPNVPGVDEEAHCGAEVALLRPRHKPGGDEPRERPQPRPHRSANEMTHGSNEKIQGTKGIAQGTNEMGQGGDEMVPGVNEIAKRANGKTRGA